MKKIYLLVTVIILLFLSPAAAICAGVGADLKLGMDFNGKHRFKDTDSDRSNDRDVDDAYSAAVEVFGKIGEMVDVGGGTVFQSNRELKGLEGQFRFTSHYAFLRLKSQLNSVTLYGTGQLGICMLSSDEDYNRNNDEFSEAIGDFDLYYGYGAGIIFFDRIMAELLYSVNQAEYEGKSVSLDITNSQLTVNIGVRF